MSAHALCFCVACSLSSPLSEYQGKTRQEIFKKEIFQTNSSSHARQHLVTDLKDIFIYIDWDEDESKVRPAGVVVSSGVTVSLEGWLSALV